LSESFLSDFWFREIDLFSAVFRSSNEAYRSFKPKVELLFLSLVWEEDGGCIAEVLGVSLAHPQPYVRLLATRQGSRVVPCLLDSGAASFNLMSEVKFFAACERDPSRFGAYETFSLPHAVGGIEAGNKTVSTVGRVMQYLVDPFSGRMLEFTTAILRNAATGDAEVIFADRQFASDQWGAIINLQTTYLTISNVGDTLPNGEINTDPLKQDQNGLDLPDRAEGRRPTSQPVEQLALVDSAELDAADGQLEDEPPFVMEEGATETAESSAVF
jgi:hypothetical protein